MKNIWKNFIFALFVFLVSCAPTKETSTKFNRAEDFEEYFKQNMKNIKTFYGTGNITIESPEFSNNAKCKVKIIYPDTLFLELKGIFGISIGMLLLRNEDYIFYNQIENKIITGNFNTLNENPYLNLNLSTREIIDFFAGKFFYNYINFNSSQLIRDKEYYIIESKTNNFKKRVWIDPDNLTIDRVVEYNDQDESIFEGIAKFYDKKLMMPTWMRIILNSTQSSLTLTYNDIQLNKEIDLEIPQILLKKLTQ